MDDAQWERIEAKRERNRHFANLETVAAQSQRDSRKIKPAPRRKKAEPTAAELAEKEERKRLRAEAAGRRRAEVEAKRQLVAERKAAVAALRAQKERQIAERRAARDEAAVAQAGKTAAHRELRELRQLRPLLRPGLPGRPRTAPQECKICERPLRPRSALIGDYPGTMAHWGHGLCQSCAQGKVPGGRTLVPQKLIHDGTTQCHRCSVTLRPTGTLAAGYPGTRVALRRLGERQWLCSTCVERDRNGRQPLKRRPANCTSCAVPMSGKKERVPGKRQYGARGLCTSCVSREYRKATAKPLPPVGPCVVCAVPLIRGRKERLPEGHRRHAGNGLCSACYTENERRKRVEARMTLAGQAA